MGVGTFRICHRWEGGPILGPWITSVWELGWTCWWEHQSSNCIPISCIMSFNQLWMWAKVRVELEMRLRHLFYFTRESRSHHYAQRLLSQVLRLSRRSGPFFGGAISFYRGCAMQSVQPSLDSWLAGQVCLHLVHFEVSSSERAQTHHPPRSVWLPASFQKDMGTRRSLASRRVRLRREGFPHSQSLKRYANLSGDGVFKVHRNSRLPHSQSSMTLGLRCLHPALDLVKSV